MSEPCACYMLCVVLSAPVCLWEGVSYVPRMWVTFLYFKWYMIIERAVQPGVVYDNTGSLSYCITGLSPASQEDYIRTCYRFADKVLN